MEWFRCDAVMPDHVKVRRLARRLGVDEDVALAKVIRLWGWVARFYENGDLSHLDPEDIADGCRWPSAPERLVDALAESGWLDRDGERLVVHGWCERQSYVLRERDRKRAARDAERKARAASADGPRARRATYVRTDVRDVQDNSTRPTASDAGPAEPGRVRHSAPAPAVPIDWGADTWAKYCPGLAKPRAPFSEARRRRWATRCAEDGFLDAFEEVCRKIGASDFCAGKGSTGWKATFDWLLERPDAWHKVLEGKYDNRTSPHRLAGLGLDDERRATFAALENA